MKIKRLERGESRGLRGSTCRTEGGGEAGKWKPTALVSDKRFELNQGTRLRLGLAFMFIARSSHLGCGFLGHFGYGLGEGSVYLMSGMRSHLVTDHAITSAAARDNDAAVQPNRIDRDTTSETPTPATRYKTPIS
jgi:hypothetical protein